MQLAVLYNAILISWSHSGDVEIRQMLRSNRWSGGDQQQHVQQWWTCNVFNEILKTVDNKNTTKLRHEGTEYASLLEIEIKAHNECWARFPQYRCMFDIYTSRICHVVFSDMATLLWLMLLVVYIFKEMVLIDFHAFYLTGHYFHVLMQLKSCISAWQLSWTLTKLLQMWMCQWNRLYHCTF